MKEELPGSTEHTRGTTMRTTIRTRINYGKLGHLTCYSGPPNSGLTLASVIHVCKLHKLDPSRQVISNTHLTKIPYKPFSIFELDQYTHSIIFIDYIHSLVDSRTSEQTISQAITKFMQALRAWDCIVVMNAPNHVLIHEPIRRQITDIFRPTYYQNKRGTPYLKLFKLPNPLKENYQIAYKPIRVRKYFKHSNTREVFNPFISKWQHV